MGPGSCDVRMNIDASWGMEFAYSIYMTAQYNRRISILARPSIDIESHRILGDILPLYIIALLGKTFVKPFSNGFLVAGYRFDFHEVLVEFDEVWSEEELVFCLANYVLRLIERFTGECRCYA